MLLHSHTTAMLILMATKKGLAQTITLPQATVNLGNSIFLWYPPDEHIQYQLDGGNTNLLQMFHKKDTILTQLYLEIMLLMSPLFKSDLINNTGVFPMQLYSTF